MKYIDEYNIEISSDIVNTHHWRLIRRVREKGWAKANYYYCPCGCKMGMYLDDGEDGVAYTGATLRCILSSEEADVKDIIE